MWTYQIHGDIHTQNCLLYVTLPDSESVIADALMHLQQEGNVTPFLLVTVTVPEWNADCSPWPAKEKFRGSETFIGHGAELLHYLQDEVMKSLGESYTYFLGGYSMGGLFSLWAATQTDRFQGIIAASPSVWYPAWDDYMETHTLLTKRVYFSLGKKEAGGGNSIFASVGTRIMQQYALAAETVGKENCTLVWNEGNHFHQVTKRIEDAVRWMYNYSWI